MEDIFLFKKMPVDKKRTIIVDTREKNSMVPSYLFKIGVNVIFEKLDVGDYLVGNTVIERKSAADFFSSVYSGHLREQMSDIKECNNKILLLEGIFDYKKFNKNVFWGCFISYSEMGIPILFVNNEKETADFLKFLGNKKIQVNKSRIKKKVKTLDEKKIFFLEGILGIGEKKAEELLEKFGSVKKTINAKEKDIKEVLNDRVFDEFKRIIS